MTIDNTSVKAENVELVDPDGNVHAAVMTTYNDANGEAIYSFTRDWQHKDSGTWTARTSVTDPVADDSGNTVPGGQVLGTFNVAIADTTRPTATLITTLNDITTAGPADVAFTVRYDDPVA